MFRRPPWLAGDPVDWLLWSYIPLRRFESEAFYRSIGIDRVYGWLLRLFPDRDHRELVHRMQAGEPALSQADLTWAVQESNYHDCVNLIRNLFLVPFTATLIWLGEIGWAVWVGLFVVVHFVSSLSDRYRRLLLFRYRDEATQRGVDLTNVISEPTPMGDPDTVFHRVPLRWWFDPKAWETERFFRAVGISLWQRHVVFMVAKAWHPPHERALPGARRAFFRETSRREMVGFEAATRMGESIHILGGLALVPVLLVFYHHQVWWAFALMVYVLATDILFAMLLRMHRARVWKLVRRLRGRGV